MKNLSLLRSPIIFAAAGLSLAGSAIALDPKPVSANDSATARYRVVWTDDPTSKATVGWEQKEGKPGTVHYGPVDEGRKPDAYPEKAAAERVVDFDGMKNCFARLSGLDPDTVYYFCIRDDKGISSRFFFQTAPAVPQDFIFVAGGDSRNFRDVRVSANMIVSKLRPHFVAFTGDMINRDDAASWQGWLDDWQETIADDGRITPLVPHRGNHEKRPESIPKLFDTPDDVYFALSIGGTLCRYYALNSEIPADGEQLAWLEEDLEKHGDETTHLVAGYHKPMRPHVSAKAEGTNPMKWADTFYKYGLDLVIESDSHVMKRTQPLRPDPDGDEGFSAAAADPKATVYIGEGCWGAPLRAADDGKSWTVATDRFNGFDWIQVSPAEIKVKTVRVKKPSAVSPIDPADPFATPAGLDLWEAGGEEILVVPGD